MNIKQTLEARFGPQPHIQLNDVDVDPAAIRAAITIGDEPVERPPLWYAIVTAEGVERTSSVIR